MRVLTVYAICYKTCCVYIMLYYTRICIWYTPDIILELFPRVRSLVDEHLLWHHRHNEGRGATGDIMNQRPARRGGCQQKPRVKQTGVALAQPQQGGELPNGTPPPVTIHRDPWRLMDLHKNVAGFALDWLQAKITTWIFMEFHGDIKILYCAGSASRKEIFLFAQNKIS